MFIVVCVYEGNLAGAAACEIRVYVRVFFSKPLSGLCLGV